MSDQDAGPTVRLRHPYRGRYARRDATIIRQIEAGVLQRQLAKRYGITPGRISLIWQQHLRRQRDTSPDAYWRAAGLSERAIHVLHYQEIRTVEELRARFSPEVFRRIPNVGRKTFAELQELAGDELAAPKFTSLRA